MGASAISDSNGATKAPVKIKLEITSDAICPFCYLGYKKICAAIEQAKQEKLPVEFSMQFKPFMLDPTLPVDHAVQKKDRYEAKFGAKAPAIISAMTERGRPWGIEFSYDGPIRNTFLSHRVMEKAYDLGGEEMQRTLVEKLFQGYFEQKKDVGDPDYLAETAVQSQVFANKKEAFEFMDSNELKNETCTAIKQASAMGISGVPFTVINSKYAVSGAQEPADFLNVFRKIAHGECPCAKQGKGAVC